MNVILVTWDRCSWFRRESSPKVDRHGCRLARIHSFSDHGTSSDFQLKIPPRFILPAFILYTSSNVPEILDWYTTNFVPCYLVTVMSLHQAIRHTNYLPVLDFLAPRLIPSYRSFSSTTRSTASEPARRIPKDGYEAALKPAPLSKPLTQAQRDFLSNAVCSSPLIQQHPFWPRPASCQSSWRACGVLDIYSSDSCCCQSTSTS